MSSASSVAVRSRPVLTPAGRPAPRTGADAGRFAGRERRAAGVLGVFVAVSLSVASGTIGRSPGNDQCGVLGNAGDRVLGGVLRGVARWQGEGGA